MLLSMAVQNSPSLCESVYRFVTQPDEDFFCPVSFELLLDPVQTECCGKHISCKARERLVKGPCPLCKHDLLVTHKDKYFQRKVLQLEVSCGLSLCFWRGELGAFDNHILSCPQSPWKCQYCNFEAILREKESHMTVCMKCPVVCPNNCEIGSIPRCDAEKHIEMCPLQPVKCEFSEVGCTQLVPRKNVAQHVKENALHHLMSTTLLNLRLMKELQFDTSNDILYSNRGFSGHRFSFSTNIRKSDLFYNFPGEYCFSFEIETRNVADEKRYYPVLNIECGSYNASLKWPVTCVLHLYLLNQRGNHDHLLQIYTISYNQPWRTWYEFIGELQDCYPLATLAYNADKNTEYCVDGCLKYKLYIKTSN